MTRTGNPSSRETRTSTGSDAARSTRPRDAAARGSQPNHTSTRETTRSTARPPPGMTNNRPITAVLARGGARRSPPQGYRAVNDGAIYGVTEGPQGDTWQEQADGSWVHHDGAMFPQSFGSVSYGHPATGYEEELERDLIRRRDEAAARRGGLPRNGASSLRNGDGPSRHEGSRHAGPHRTMMLLLAMRAHVMVLRRHCEMEVLLATRA
ncbi:MAG: hypothetical protein LQ346_007890 [Caloplaca aetnensis]|nr:MAG: hypothetical protein LQ346_007890 [Caloplaca aetnensis]